MTKEEKIKYLEDRGYSYDYVLEEWVNENLDCYAFRGISEDMLNREGDFKEIVLNVENCDLTPLLQKV